MGYYDAYNAILSVSKSTLRDSRIEIAKRTITNAFYDSPSYYQVPTYTASTPLSSTPLDVWIVDDSDTQDLKQIQVLPDQTLNYGDIINWNGEYWITTLVDYMGGIYYRGSIQKCYSSIKWIDKDTNETIESYFTIISRTQRSIGLQDGNIIILPNERRYISIQNNAYTRKIVKGQKFILDGERAWRVAGINTLFSGIIQLELEEILVDDAKDDTNNRVADNTKPTVPADPNILF